MILRLPSPGCTFLSGAALAALSKKNSLLMLWLTKPSPMAVYIDQASVSAVLCACSGGRRSGFLCPKGRGKGTQVTFQCAGKVSIPSTSDMLQQYHL
jgi:hypothetical protein